MNNIFVDEILRNISLEIRISRRSRLIHDVALMNVRIMSIGAAYFRSHASFGAWQPLGMTCPDPATNAFHPLLALAFLAFVARQSSTCRHAGKKTDFKRSRHPVSITASWSSLSIYFLVAHSSPIIVRRNIASVVLREWPDILHDVKLGFKGNWILLECAKIYSRIKFKEVLFLRFMYFF